jgi:predicted ThiF/HesA family dinucleotide-utilizing enzyme
MLHANTNFTIFGFTRLGFETMVTFGQVHHKGGQKLKPIDM